MMFCGREKKRATLEVKVHSASTPRSAPLVHRLFLSAFPLAARAAKQLTDI